MFLIDRKPARAPMMQKAMRMAGKMRRWLGFIVRCRSLQDAVFYWVGWVLSDLLEKQCCTGVLWSNIQQTWDNSWAWDFRFQISFNWSASACSWKATPCELEISHLCLLFTLLKFLNLSKALFTSLSTRLSDQDNYEQVGGKVIKPPSVVFPRKLGDLICAGHLKSPKHCYKCPLCWGH